MQDNIGKAHIVLLPHLLPFVSGGIASPKLSRRFPFLLTELFSFFRSSDVSLPDYFYIQEDDKKES